jgi:hypothetical protein
MNRHLMAAIVIAFGTIAGTAAGLSESLPKDVIEPREEGTVPTAVWLAECEGLFDDFWAARHEIDETVAAGGYGRDPAGLARDLHTLTVPRAQAVADFCSEYVPDTAWGRQLRSEVIDAMVSSLASDAHVVEMIEGEARSEVPLADMLAEQKEISETLIASVYRRLREAPKKYRKRPEELEPSRAFYFQDFRVRGPARGGK